MAPDHSRRGRGLRRSLIGLAALAALLIGLGFLADPPLVKAKLESTLSAMLERRTTVGRVAFKPFTLTATVTGVEVRDRDADTPLARIAEIVANVSSTTLWRRAPVIDALTVRAPELHLVRRADGTYNVQDLVAAYLDTPPGPVVAASIANIVVVDGVVEFDDRPMGRKHRIDAIEIGLPYLSSLPYDVEVKVAPVLKARVNGTPLALSGESTPFADSRRTTLDIDLNRLELPVYADYMPVPMPVRVAAGELTTRFKLTFVDGDAATRAVRVAGGFSVTDIALHAPDGTPLMTIPAMGFGLQQLDFHARSVDVGQIAFERPEFGVVRRADGGFELAGLAVPARKPPVGPETAATQRPPAAPIGATGERPWHVRLGEARVAGGRVRLADSSTTPEFRAEMSELALTANDLSNAAGTRGRVAVSFKSDLGASVVAEGEVGLAPFAASGKLDGTGVDLRGLYPYYASVLNLEVADGTLDLAARFEVAQRDPDTTAVALSEGEATVRRLSVLLPGEREPLWSVPEAVASGIAVDLDRRSLEIGQLTARKASARLRREADGTFDWARLLRTDATTGSGSGEPTWQVTIRRAGLERTTLEIEDRGPKPPVRLRLSELDVRGENYSNGRDTQGTLAVAGRIGTGGRVAATGPFGTNPLTGRLRMDATGVALVPFQPYLVPRVNATVTSGTVAASGTFAFDVADGGEMRASYAGDIVVSDFASLDPLTASDLVEWKTLRLAQVDAVLAPLRLGIGAARLDGVFARVIVYADGGCST